MAVTDFVESVRSLILSHCEKDDASFRRNVEIIIRALTTQNRPAEAKSLRDALKSLPTSRKATKSTSAVESNSLTVLSRQSSGLISFADRASPTTLVFSKEAQITLEEILAENRLATKLAEAGLTPRNRLLFWGPPGCGKTAAAGWLAQELEMPCGVVCLASLITSFVGETGSNINKVLRTAEETPMVLLIDEADAIAKSRRDVNDVGELRRVVNSLLQNLDSFSGRDSIVVFASNHSETFDEAVWRRFDAIVNFPMPEQEERLTLLKQLTGGMRTTGSLLDLAQSLAGASFAEIERAVLDVARQMVVTERKSVTTKQIAAAYLDWKRKTQDASRRPRTTTNEPGSTSSNPSKSKRKSAAPGKKRTS